MPRYKLTLEYDGTPFVGWQAQANGRSVQQVLSEAIEKFAGERVTVFGAGRTDAGVHALGQVAHMDLTKAWDEHTVHNAINEHLKPEPVAVLNAETAADDFDARFSARKRHYLYRIVNRRAPLALERGRAWFMPQTLDGDAMHAAAQALVGHHDFSSFRAAECQAKSPLKTLERLTVSRRGEELHLEARAPSFLHRQVRNLVGSLVQVGLGKWNRAKLAAVLAARDRTAAGPTAPAEGLYLVAVEYPD